MKDTESALRQNTIVPVPKHTLAIKVRDPDDAWVLASAVAGGANVLVTGDVKYHEARDAEDLGIGLIDAGHFHTEIIMAAEVQARLQKMLPAAGFGQCRVISCSVETDPFRYLP